jgi:hypothetical protein
VSTGSLRKRLDRLEKILKAKSDTASPAAERAQGLVDEIATAEQISRLSNIIAQAKADAEGQSEEDAVKCFLEAMQESERIHKEEWKRTLKENQMRAVR